MRIVAPAAAQLRDVSVDDRWRADVPGALMTGVQASIRALFDSVRSDRAAGKRTGGFVSGYQGSPLGGLDKEISRRRDDLRDLSITFQPGVNEELAATAVWGSQLAYLTPGAVVDGVLGMWYGKHPGLDRAADAIRHANLSGVGPGGGAVAIVGDDPSCKSSTLPSAAERTLSGLHVPVLAPSSVQDVLELGRHAFAMSRAAATWVALKLVADLADASAVVRLDGRVELGARLVELTPTARLLGGSSLEPERRLFAERLPAALTYARAAGLNRVDGAGGDARHGVVASGATYAMLLRALEELGIGGSSEDLERVGLRVLKLGLVWPVDPELVRSFSAGLRSVLVLEDKLPFVETEIRAALFGVKCAPDVAGKRLPDGTELLPSHGALSVDDIARALTLVLPAKRLAAATVSLPVTPVAAVPRTPYFCSGCPHSTSTRAEPGTLVGAGIGCHVMLVQRADERSGEVLGLTQMGGEGTQWIGIAPFTERRHFTQNLGDGTFHHSGSLALRAAVAAGVNVTYKLLYNDAVAMTGGQRVEGLLAVPELTRLLEAEGVARTVVTTDDVDRYRGVALAANASVRPRLELRAVARELAVASGVTVIVHDQQCAAERRRLRKRGAVPTPAERVWINERVCEGCGDCGQKSGCLSVLPVETEYGRKTRVDGSTCNLDFSCLEGDCPSFLTVRPRQNAGRGLPPAPAAPSPQELSAASDVSIRMVGIGGTGVLTASQVLAMAAHLDGRSVSTVDQTGLSQKAGPVVSDLRITSDPVGSSARPPAGGADVLLAFDPLSAVQPALLAAVSPERTVAVMSTSLAPTGAMVTDASVPAPDARDLTAAIAARCASVACALDCDALARRLFRNAMPANMLLLGAAWQDGLIPVSWAALERAVELNGAAVEMNTAALGWGRALADSPARADELLTPTAPAATAPPPWLARRVAAMALPSERAAELAMSRGADLVDWGGRRAATRFLVELERMARREVVSAPGRAELTEAFAAGLHKLLAYKDEYEVARLHLLPTERARREAEFGPDAAVWVHLHPPALRALGFRRKLRLGGSAVPLFVALRAMRRVRGTPLDPFGCSYVRRVERSLPGEYVDAVHAALAFGHARAIAVAESPDIVRGYETLKLRNVERWRAVIAELVAPERAENGQVSHPTDPARC